MTQQELTDWALRSGWQLVAGHPSLCKPGRPGEAIVRLVLKATVAHLEIRKPAGKWEKVGGAAYGAIVVDPESGMPHGLGFEAVPSFATLMRQNRDAQVFANFGGR